MQPDDAYWRRPEEGGASSQWAPPSSPAPASPELLPRSGGLPNLIYQGPPVSVPPPAGWRPTRVVEPVPPRQLPAQDHAAIDDQEARARSLSFGMAIAAASVMAILLIAICGRTLF